MSIKQQTLRASSSCISADARLPQLQFFVEPISQASVAERWSTTTLFPVIADSPSRQCIYNTVVAVDGKNVGCAFKKLSIWTSDSAPPTKGRNSSLIDGENKLT